MNRTYKEITIFVNATATQEINSIQRTSDIQISEYILLHIATFSQHKETVLS